MVGAGLGLPRGLFTSEVEIFQDETSVGDRLEFQIEQKQVSVANEYEHVIAALERLAKASTQSGNPIV